MNNKMGNSNEKKGAGKVTPITHEPTNLLIGFELGELSPREERVLMRAALANQKTFEKLAFSVAMKDLFSNRKVKKQILDLWDAKEKKVGKKKAATIRAIKPARKAKAHSARTKNL